MAKSKRRRLAVGGVAIAGFAVLSSASIQPGSATSRQQPHGVPAAPAGKAVVNFSDLAAGPQLVGPPRALPSLLSPSVTRSSGPAGPAPSVGPLVASPAPSLNYIGVNDNAALIPPDTGGAVGLTRTLATTNERYRVLTKATGATVSTTTMSSFWALTGASGTFDPETRYDPYNDRFIVVGASNARSATSSILVGVSTSGDPNGTYNLFRFPACAAPDYPCGAGTTDWWADYPTVGFNKNWVAIGVNMFTNAGDSFTESRLLVLNYANLRANSLAGGMVFPGMTSAFTIQPCSTYSATESTLYMPEDGSYSGSPLYRLDTITGAVGSPVLTLGPVKSHTAASLAGGWEFVTGETAPQADGSALGDSALIDGGDARILNCVFRNNAVWYAQTIGLPAGGPVTRSAAQWVKLDTNGDDLDGGRIQDPTATATNGGKWYAYPTIAVNQFGNAMVGYTQFSSGQWPSAGYSYRNNGDLIGSMQDPQIYKGGEGFYWKTYAGTCTAGSNRWGDFSATQVDPSDDTAMWTVQEYSRPEGALTGAGQPATGCGSGVWGTWWAQITAITTALDVSSVSARRIPGAVRVSWRTASEARVLGFKLYRNGVKINRTLIRARYSGRPQGGAYVWVDHLARSGRFRLLIVDVHGRTRWAGGGVVAR